MAKRYTDTDKWKDDWYLSLSNDMRIVWQYIIDNCTIAGVWKKAFKSLNYFCNTNITEEEFIKIFTPRVIDCGTFFFIPKFLKFQYPLGLISDKPLIVSVMKEVSFLNLSTMIVESLGNDYPIIKVTGKGNDKRKKVKGNKDNTVKGEKQKIIFPFTSQKFITLWSKWIEYRRQINKPYKNEFSEQAALKQLSQFDEDFSINLIENSIANNYQGLVFSNTKTDYLKNRNDGHNTIQQSARNLNDKIDAIYGTSHKNGFDNH